MPVVMTYISADDAECSPEAVDHSHELFKLGVGAMLWGTFTKPIITDTDI